jgi:hypothetical protein
VQIDVEFSGKERRRLTATINFAGVRYAPETDAAYARYLYILAWADGLAPFRVPVKLTVG